MKSEISRNSHQPDKKYSGVYQQQGRMLTDSDWNESVDVLKAQLKDALNDIVGNGSPRKMSLVNNETAPPKLQWGYLHVDGIQAEVRSDENASSTTDFQYENQQDFPSAPSLPGTGTPTVASQDYRLYADVWERTVTYLQDKRLLDSGLHGADTCTRKQSMAQVKWCPFTVDPEQSDRNPGKGNSELSLTLRTKSSEADPCDPCAAELDIDARTGNYLFRVEIHDVEGDADAPTKITWKWSSENGAEQFEARAASEMPAGFVDSKWTYEFFSETSEKQLGVHLLDATDFPVRGSLTEAYPAALPTGFDFVRRWDGYCVFSWNASISAWELTYGTEHGTSLGVDIESSSADKVLMLDAHAMVLQLLARVVGESVTSNALGVSDLIINGVDAPASKAGDDILSTVDQAASAIAKVAAVNAAFVAVTGDAKVIAEVNANVVTGSAPTAFALIADDIAEGDLEINGEAIAAILAAGDIKAQADAVVNAINQKLSSTGVEASRDDNGIITLLSGDGRNIHVVLTVTATTARCGLTATTSYGSITVSSRSDVTLSGSAPGRAGFIAGVIPSVKFIAGDFWLAEVREAEHKAGDVLVDHREPEGIRHRYLELGSVIDSVLQVNPEADRKYAFPPLTEMTRMLYAGGDGQEAMPSLELPQPIEVAVANGQWRVKDTSVQFEIVSGSGSLIRLDGSDPGNSLTVKTLGTGIAACRWVLGPLGSDKPRVKATLLDPEDTPSRQSSLDHPPLFFNANLSTAAEVAYEPHCQPDTEETTLHHLLLGPDSAKLGEDGYYTVKEVLDALLCELKADHVPYDDPGCGTTTSPSVGFLLPGLDENGDGHITVKDVLDTLLCDLRANHIPFYPDDCTTGEPITVKSKLGINDPTSVHAILQKLICELDAEDIPFDPEDCDHGVLQPTVKTGLGLSNGVRTTIHEVLQKLLCDFNATHLPVDHAGLCAKLKILSGNKKVTTVQKAINALCNMERGNGGCAVTVGKGGTYTTLDEALSKLNGESVISLCLLPGDHNMTMDFKPGGLQTLKITGSGTAASRIIAVMDKSFLIVADKEVILRDLSFSIESQTEGILIHANRVDVQACAFERFGVSRGASPLVSIDAPNEGVVYWENNYVVSTWSETKPSKIKGIYMPETSVLPSNAKLRKDLITLFKLDPVVDMKIYETKLTEVATMIAESPQIREEWVNKKPDGLIAELKTTRGMYLSRVSGVSLGATAVSSGTERFAVTAAESSPKVAAENFYATMNNPGVTVENIRDTLNIGIISMIQTGFGDCLGLAGTNIGGMLGNSIFQGNLVLNADITDGVDFGDKMPFDVNVDPYVITDVNLRIAGNQFNRIVTRFPPSSVDLGGKSLIEAVDGYQSLFISENVFSGVQSSLVAGTLHFQGNQFSDEGNDKLLSVLSVFGMYTGNGASSENRIISTMKSSNKKAANWLNVN